MYAETSEMSLLIKKAIKRELKAALNALSGLLRAQQVINTALTY